MEVLFGKAGEFFRFAFEKPAQVLNRRADAMKENIPAVLSSVLVNRRQIGENRLRRLPEDPCKGMCP
jgi:hypothetical protein